MSWAGDQTEELRAREDKIEDLGNEKEHERFAEMPLERNSGERHTGEVAERVSWKRPRWIPVKVMSGSRSTMLPHTPIMPEESSANPCERCHEIEAHEVPLDHFSRSPF